ncbi:MAG: STAS domain-containing protein [Deltaproteobacteria bacterium]|nr:STAS domain-containing protein [Deltaproteobacteria bacterium]
MMLDAGRIPIITLHDFLLVPIQTALSDRLVSQLKDDITAAIVRVAARGLIVDVSGIDVMDSYISRSLRDIGMVARLMGVRTVIAGINPMIAMTLVEMDISLGGVDTALNLESALEQFANIVRVLPETEIWREE